MKGKLLVGSIALLSTLASCDKNYSMEEVTSGTYAPAINIITSLSDGAVTVSGDYYYFDLKNSSQTGMTGTVSVGNLIANNTQLGFTTFEDNYRVEHSNFVFANVSGNVTTNPSLSLKNADFLGVFYDQGTFGYYYDTTEAGQYTFPDPKYLKNPYITVARYFIGDQYRVNTFQNDTFFKGTTTTKYPMGDGQFTTSDITYRFIIRQVETEEPAPAPTPDSSTEPAGETMKKSTGYKADMIMYKARFASLMPITLDAIVVKDLDVIFSDSNVIITGSDIIPEVFGDGGFTPYPNYTFNNFTFTTTDDFYVNATIDYKVAGMFDGHFEGSYLKSYFLENK